MKTEEIVRIEVKGKAKRKSGRGLAKYSGKSTRKEDVISNIRRGINPVVSSGLFPENTGDRVFQSGRVRYAVRMKFPKNRTSYGISTIIQDIKQGYPIAKFDLLKDAFGINGEALAKLASISSATIHRRKSTGRLTLDESEKIYRLQNLYETALEVLETEENVKEWINTPQRVFEGKTALEYADTLPGCLEVERVLRRMEHGVVQ